MPGRALSDQLHKSPAVFLDRDGVINRDQHFVHRIEDFEFLDGVHDALREIRRRGFKTVVVTNQSGIGRGLYSQQAFDELNEWMLATLKAGGIAIDAVYHCPHAPDENCRCRKPAPGMLLQAADEWNLDLARSWMVGDKPSDVEAARRAGVTNTVLVRSGQSFDSAAAAKTLFVCDRLRDMIPLLPPISEGGPADS